MTVESEAPAPQLSRKQIRIIGIAYVLAFFGLYLAKDFGYDAAIWSACGSGFLTLTALIGLAFARGFRWQFLLPVILGTFSIVGFLNSAHRTMPANVRDRIELNGVFPAGHPAKPVKGEEEAAAPAQPGETNEGSNSAPAL